jgi:hypothetical protein
MVTHARKNENCIKEVKSRFMRGIFTVIQFMISHIPVLQIKSSKIKIYRIVILSGVLYERAK